MYEVSPGTMKKLLYCGTRVALNWKRGSLLYYRAVGTAGLLRLHSFCNSVVSRLPDEEKAINRVLWPGLYLYEIKSGVQRAGYTVGIVSSTRLQ